jgi:hypothetical protein
MKPLALLLFLDVALLSVAYWMGSFFGLVLIMGFGFVLALGAIVFSTAPPSRQKQESYSALDSFTAFSGLIKN